VLVEAVKEQQKEIEELKEMVLKLEKQIRKLK
jgi:cell division protein FtsB